MPIPNEFLFYGSHNSLVMSGLPEECFCHCLYCQHLLFFHYAVINRNNCFISVNCLMFAIGTGLKTEFLGTVKISYGCVLCIVAFSLAAVLCPVYLTDATNTVKQFKKEHYEKFSWLNKMLQTEWNTGWLPHQPEEMLDKYEILKFVL